MADVSADTRSLYAAGSPEDLMEESADETQRREDMLKMLKLTKDALKLLGKYGLSGHAVALH
jgi:hypothetical protein